MAPSNKRRIERLEARRDELIAADAHYNEAIGDAPFGSGWLASLGSPLRAEIQALNDKIAALRGGEGQ